MFLVSRVLKRMIEFRWGVIGGLTLVDPGVKHCNWD